MYVGKVLFSVMVCISTCDKLILLTFWAYYAGQCDIRRWCLFYCVLEDESKPLT